MIIDQCVNADRPPAAFGLMMLRGGNLALRLKISSPSYWSRGFTTVIDSGVLNSEGDDLAECMESPVVY
jgi:hypothetical protein